MKPCDGCKTFKACLQAGKCLGKKKKSAGKKAAAKTSPSGGGY
jgi:hypothetical protein